MPILLRGDPAPWFLARGSSTPHSAFESTAGRYVVLCFLGSGGNTKAAATLGAAVRSHRALFDDKNVRLFCISTDPDDRRLGRLRESLPGIRHIWDFDRAVSRLYGAVREDGETGRWRYVPFWLVLDPMLRTLYVAPLSDAEDVMKFIAELPPCECHAGIEMSAPVLTLPRVFEPDFLVYIRLPAATRAVSCGIKAE